VLERQKGLEAKNMLTMLLPTILLLTLVVSPLVWRIRADRRRDRADILRADIYSAVNRRLHGESLLTVEVEPKTLWHSGRVVLWTPAGYEDLAESVWRDVAGRMPVDYELVVKPGHAEEPLRRAA
jgi:hypothetical protein